MRGKNSNLFEFHWQQGMFSTENLNNTKYNDVGIFWILFIRNLNVSKTKHTYQMRFQRPLYSVSFVCKIIHMIIHCLINIFMAGKNGIPSLMGFK